MKFISQVVRHTVDILPGKIKGFHGIFLTMLSSYGTRWLEIIPGCPKAHRVEGLQTPLVRGGEEEEALNRNREDKQLILLSHDVTQLINIALET